MGLKKELIGLKNKLLGREPENLNVGKTTVRKEEVK